jgi:hypothetical protein
MALPVNPVSGSGGQLIVERALADLTYAIKVYLPNAIVRGVTEALDENVTPMTNALYRGMGGGVFPEKPMLEANKKIARRAQEAIVGGWRARLPLKSKPYRRGADPNKNRLSGKLGEALESPDMISGTTARGISFLNTSLLATEARHWYRVNYGAYGYRVGSIRRPKAYPVMIGGHSVFALKDEMRPAPNSWLPRGGLNFSDDGVVSPRKGPADVEGGGHRAALFTDLGYRAIAENADPVYRQMLMSYFRKGGLAERYNAKGVNITVKV